MQVWGGLNQQAPRGSIGDDEEWWNENLFKVGQGNLRSCWGRGPPIYTAPSGKKILRMFFGFIGYPTPQFAAPGPSNGGRLGWMFLSDGTVDQVDLDLQTVVHLGQIWQPISPQYWASAVVWRPRFFGSVQGQNGGVLFGSPQGLYAWDGQTLSSPGDQAPDWLTDQAETAPGSPPGGYQMPVGLPGIYCMEVYQSRLFVAGKDVIAFSAPSNGADFSTTDGGGSFGYFGNKLTYSFMDLAESSGYLYCFSDSAIHIIANVNLAGSGTPQSPYVTNLQFQNLDPQIGQRFPRPVGRNGRYLQMFNGAGMFELRGGETIQIGYKTQQVYDTLDTSLYLPTMAAATMFGQHVLLCNGRFKDPWGRVRSMMLMWHPMRGEGDGTPFWSVASQGLELTQIGNYEQDSIITPYGTDGDSLYQLFAAPDPTLIKKLSTKYLRGGMTDNKDYLSLRNWTRLFLEFDDHYGRGVAFTGKITTSAGGIPGGVKDVGFQLTPGAGYAFEPQPIESAGIAGAIDLESLSPDFSIERLHIASQKRTLFGA